MQKTANIQQRASGPTLKVIDGKYIIKKEELGRGSFAITHLTVLEPNTLLACKMICKQKMLEKIQVAENKEARRNYIINSIKNEVNTWKLLDHPNVVKFYDFSETSNNIYFFSEYCEQGDLNTMISKQGRIPEKQALRIFRDIVAACSFLYDRNIFHRDLKPENILLSNGIAKISDFGFAKAIEEAEKKDNPTVQTSIGTPFYMSPEILNNEPYSIKCDVWSLGVTIYKMLYGMCPWSAHNLLELVKMVKKKVQFPKNDQVSTELKVLISRMLIPNEANRISIKELEKEVNALCQRTFGMDIE